MGAVAKGLLIYEKMRKYLVIYQEAVSHLCLCNRSRLNFLICEEYLIFFFISAYAMGTIQGTPSFAHIIVEQVH
jgi:hypothetical protein